MKMNPLKLLKSDLKYLNGFLPINKPSGLCCNKLRNLIRSDLNFTLENQDVHHGDFQVYYSRSLEPFASGIVTLIFGNSNYRRRNFVYAEYKHEAVIEFGVERESHCIGGSIVSRAKTCHLNDEVIGIALKSFEGTYPQSRCEFLNDKAQDDLELSEMLASPKGIYNLIQIENAKPIVKYVQKYPLLRPDRIVICDSIKLIEYNEPFATLDIDSRGSFNIRQFVFDLGEKLGTKASLMKLNRYREGPIYLDDQRVLQIHETQVEHYLPKLRVIQKLYDNYTSTFDHLFNTEGGYRPKM